MTIAWLGGSITQAWPDGYAYQTTAWLRTRYPSVTFQAFGPLISVALRRLGQYCRV